MSIIRNPPVQIVRVPQITAAATLRNHQKGLRRTIAIHGAGMSRPAVCNILDQIATLERLAKYAEVER